MLLLALAARVTMIARPGFSPDEDLTWLAVRAVEARGLPILASGVLYDRGIPFTYAAWAAGAVTTPALSTFRWVSALCGVCSVFLVFAVVQRLGGSLVALAAMFLLAIQPEQIALSQWARFYSPLVAASLLAVWVFTAPPERGGIWPFVIIAVLARLLHEMGAGLLLVPVFGYAVSPRRSEARARSARMALVTAAALVAVQVALFSLQVYAADGDAAAVAGRWQLQATAALPAPLAIQDGWHLSFRTSLWLTIALMLATALQMALRPGLLVSATVAALALPGYFAAIVFASIIAALIRPENAWRAAAAGAAAIVVGIVVHASSVALTTGAPASLQLIRSVASFGFSASTDAVHYYAALHPGFVALLALAIAVVCACDRSADVPHARVVLLTLVAGLFLLGVLRFGYQARYFAAFSPLILVAAAGLGAFVSLRPRGAMLVCAVTVAIAAMEHRAVVAAPDRKHGWLAGMFHGSAPLTLHDPAWAGLGKRVRDGEPVFCNDEPAALLILQRCEYWLAFNLDDRSRFTVMTSLGSRSLYGGRPVIEDRNTFIDVMRSACHDRRCWMLLVNTGRFDFDRYHALATEFGRHARSQIAGATWRLASISPGTR